MVWVEEDDPVMTNKKLPKNGSICKVEGVDILSNESVFGSFKFFTGLGVHNPLFLGVCLWLYLRSHHIMFS